MRPLLRAGFAGVATGARSMIVLAAAARTPGSASRSERFLHRPRVCKALGRSAAFELVGDKLPQTPPRTAAPSLSARVTLGGLTGALVSVRGGGSARAGALLGVGAATAWTVAGPRYRAAVAARAGNDLAGALAEDAIALALARLATRGGGR